MSTTTTAPRHPKTTPAPPADTGAKRTRRLARYLALDTQQEREIVRIQRPDGSALVVDYQLDTRNDGRLVAHLSPDEPTENAQIVCELYLVDDERRGRCRAVTSEDFDASRHITPSPSSGHGPRAVSRPQDAAGHVYRITEVRTLGDAPELRWTRSRHPDHKDSFDIVTLREVVASLEAYEPARTLTRDALARCDECVSTRQLREEEQRLADSAIVLNRGLREAVQRELSFGAMTMSDIAARCGRFRNDPPGSSTGEASWVARRIGQIPGGGEDKPCPWVHTDVLALIARDGLGICPHEVEL